jgi:hypothetical protein
MYAEIMDKEPNTARALRENWMKTVGEKAGPLGPGFCDYAYGVHLEKSALLEIWPVEEQLRQDGPAQTHSSGAEPPKNRGGANPRYEWERALIAVARRIHEEGLPLRQTGELHKFIEDWFGKQGQYPSESEIRKRVRLIYEEFPHDAPE